MSHGSAIDLSKLNLLKEQLGANLRRAEDLSVPLGIRTGVSAFDEALLWKGFPSGDLTVAISSPGLGVTSLWLNGVRQLHREGKWAAWIGSEWNLYPAPPFAEDLDWDRLILVERPARPESFFWILQEMISSALFDFIGCHLPDFFLKTHQIVKLKNLARMYKVALVFFLERRRTWVEPLCALVFEARRGDLILHRALHRSTPRVLPEVLRHARALSPLLRGSQLFLG